MPIRWFSLLVAIALWFASILQMCALALGWYWGSLSQAGPLGRLLGAMAAGESVATIGVAIVFGVILLSFPAHVWNAWREYAALAVVYGQPLKYAREHTFLLPVSSAVRRRLELLLGDGPTNIETVREALAGRAAADAIRIESRFRLTHALIWVLPVAGFMGTALALTQAIGGFGEALNLSSDIKIISERLSQTVIPGLSEAFMVTVVALLSAVVAYVTTVAVQGWQSDVASDLDAAASVWFGELSGTSCGGGQDVNRIVEMMLQIAQQLALLADTRNEMAAAANELQSAAKELHGAARGLEKSWQVPFRVTVDRG